MTAFDQTVTINGVRYPVADPPGVVEQMISRLAGKQLIGPEPTQQDDTILSTWAMGDFSGGLGLARYEVGGITDKYRMGDLDTRWKGRLFTLPSAATATVGGATNYTDPYTGGWTVVPKPSDGQLVPVWWAGAKYQVAASTPTTAGFGTSFSTPYTTQTVASITSITDMKRFGANVYIACATTGGVPLDYRYTSNLTARTTAVDTNGHLPMKFAVLGEALYCLAQKSGDTQTIYVATTSTPNSATPTWTDIITGGFKREDDTTNNAEAAFFVQGYSQQGLPCLYAGIGRFVYYIDVVKGQAQKIFELPVPHKDGSTANADVAVKACVWEKTGNLYVAQGYNLWEVAGSIRNISPYADGDGLPNGLDDSTSLYMYGRIADVFPRREGLCAVVDGASFPMVVEWRGSSWHPLVTMADFYTRLRSFLGASFGAMGRGICVNGAVIVRWNATGGSNTDLAMVWDQDTATPPWARDTAQFASSFKAGTVLTPTFDGGFPFDFKLFTKLLIDGRTNDSIDLRLADARSAAYTTVYNATLTDNFAESSTLTSGAPYRVAKVLLKLTGGGAVGEGMLYSVGLKYTRRFKPLFGWTLTVDLVNDFEGRSPEAMRAELLALLDPETTTGAFTFAFNGEGPFYVVPAAQSGRVTNSTANPTAMMRLNFLQTEPTGGFL